VQTNINAKAFSDVPTQQQISMSVNQSTNNSVGQSNYGNAFSSLFSILPSTADNNPIDEQQP
jgi:hypothetical protein